MSDDSTQAAAIPDEKAPALAAAVMLLPAWMVSAWVIWEAKWFWSKNPELQFGYVVVLLCGFLLYEAWDARPSVRGRWGLFSVLSMALGAGALFLTQLYQTAYGMTPSSMSGLGLGYIAVVLAALHFAFGWPGVRRFAFGFLFLLIALPVPGVIYTPVVSGLQSGVARIDTEILNLIGIPAQQVGSLIHLPGGTVGIDEACSGVRSLQSTIMAALFIGYVSFKSIGLRVTLLVLGIFLAVLGNVGRSLYLCLMAHWRGMDSISQVHDAAGWSVLAFTAAGVILFAWLIGRVEKLASAAAIEEKLTEDADGGDRAVPG